MNPTFTTVASWSYGIAGLAYAAFALYLGAGWHAGTRGLAMIVAVALTALWALFGFGFALTQAREFLTLAALADVLRVGAWYAFLLLLIKHPTTDRAERESRRVTFLVPLAAALVVIGVVAYILDALKWNVYVESARLAVFDALALTVFGLVLVELLFRNVPEDGRWSIKPLCLGLAAAFAFDLYVFADALLVNRIDPDAWSVRGFVQAMVIPLLGISAMRNRDWTFRIALSRRIVFHSTALIVAGVYLMFMSAAGYYVRFVGGNWGGALQVALGFAALLALVAMAFSGSIRAKLRVIVSKHFFSYRYDYRDEWLRFTHALSARGTQSELGQNVIKGLADMLESPAGGLWLRDSVGRHFAQAARWNMPAEGATEPADSRFARFLFETGWVVNLEEFRSSPERYRELMLPLWLSELPNAWLIIPLANADELFGFVILATARTRVDVNWEVNDLLKTAARQAATFLGQMQATEALLEARKFDAFNRMSAFVVHDLKNIVAQLSLMLKNAERHRGNPEFQKDMLMTVEHSVERMKQLMMELREGTTPVDAPGAVDLSAVIGRIVRAKSNQQPVPEMRVEQRLIARGHEDRLERVIGHLVQNAIDATGETGRVWIGLAEQNGMAMVEVGDTGLGMTQEFVRERLFKPFQTTKATGMGIGAYESFQYVQELGGRVQVDSTPEAGTKVRLLLPLVELSDTAARPARREVA
ncbi:MAG TPA: XrtA/PEP-CTERM system histidine kinase PrsK [Casimicrobiaceae bacterium]|nr:XrtA/PEP-CTERM system histidine kinase PrsK [Casimicrobiaceae bacterium]